MSHIPAPRPERIAQAAAVPYRRASDDVAVCLITSLKKKLWIFPKGIIDPGETAEETALKEAYEEAGLHGRIVGEPLGSYQDFKWGATIDVTVLLMEVSDFEERWPEADVRQRRWLRPAAAMDLIEKPELRHVLQCAIDRCL
jgi:8-oxo-dGTP pyrophosphatase MutT (NUDIX family)